MPKRVACALEPFFGSDRNGRTNRMLCSALVGMHIAKSVAKRCLRPQPRRLRASCMPTAPRASDIAVQGKETTMTRTDLTEKILDIKRDKGWTWKYICDEVGGF